MQPSKLPPEHPAMRMIRAAHESLAMAADLLQMVPAAAGVAPMDPQTAETCAILEEEILGCVHKADRLKAEGRLEEVEDELAKAARYQARVAFLRDGKPLPPAMRTPSDSLDAVNELRHLLVELTQSVNPAEVKAFMVAVGHNDEDLIGRAMNHWQELQNIGRSLCVLLGYEGNTFRRFRSPRDVPAVILTDKTARVIR